MQKQFQKAFEVNKIHPIIDWAFQFEQAKEAYEYMQRAQHFGKIAINIG